jgi:hypothetical protein
VLLRELSGHLAPSFTDDLNEMRQGEAKILVRVVGTARKTLGLADCLFRHVEHVPHIDEVTRQHFVTVSSRVECPTMNGCDPCRFARVVSRSRT